MYAVCMKVDRYVLGRYVCVYIGRSVGGWVGSMYVCMDKPVIDCGDLLTKVRVSSIVLAAL